MPDLILGVMSDTKTLFNHRHFKKHIFKRRDTKINMISCLMMLSLQLVLINQPIFQHMHTDPLKIRSK